MKTQTKNERRQELIEKLKQREIKYGELRNGNPHIEGAALRIFVILDNLSRYSSMDDSQNRLDCLNSLTGYWDKESNLPNSPSFNSRTDVYRAIRSNIGEVSNESMWKRFIEGCENRTLTSVEFQRTLLGSYGHAAVQAQIWASPAYESHRNKHIVLPEYLEQLKSLEMAIREFYPKEHKETKGIVYTYEITEEQWEEYKAKHLNPEVKGGKS